MPITGQARYGGDVPLGKAHEKFHRECGKSLPALSGGHRWRWGYPAEHHFPSVDRGCVDAPVGVGFVPPAAPRRPYSSAEAVSMYPLLARRVADSLDRYAGSRTIGVGSNGSSGVGSGLSSPVTSG